MEQYLKAFAIGASFFSAFVTLTYTAKAFEITDKKPEVSQQLLNIGIRIAYGLANTVLVFLGNTLPNAAAVGAIFGEIMSLIGRYKLNLPFMLFGLKQEDTWKVHVIAPFMYMLIFTMLVYNLNNIFL